MANSRQTGPEIGRTAAQAVVLDVLQRRAAGESLTDDQVIASRPDLAAQLRVELAKLQQICAAGMADADNGREVDSISMTVTANVRADRTPGMLQFQCPHCRKPFETATDTPVTETTCSSCGGHFSLAGENKATRTAPSLQSLAHFDLVERLGVGGFGTVWKARDRKLDRTVAVKIPRQGMLSNDELEKFLREARAAAQLQHPNIVRVYEVGRDGDSVFIVSDFVRGIPLDEWLTGQQPTMRQAAEICAVIAEALQHAHDRGVIHRDLKPANIIIDAEGRPHLMDFGLARRQVGEITLTLDGQVLGTPAYMSPEQAQGEAHTADVRSDGYSLGVILFQLLTGELPFRGSARMLMHQVIHDEPPSPRRFNAHIPRDLETITLKCLEKNRDNRYQSANELASDLRRWLTGEAVTARPIGSIRRFWRWYIRRADLIAGFCTAFTGLFMLPTWLFQIVVSFSGFRRNAPIRWENWPIYTSRIAVWAAILGLFVYSAVLSIRGRKAGFLLSTFLFSAAPIVTIAAAPSISTRFILDSFPILSWVLLGVVLQIIALVQQFRRPVETTSLQQSNPRIGLIDDARRWCHRRPAAASAVAVAVMLGVLTIASSAGWLAFHGISKKSSTTTRSNNQSFVEPSTAELRKRIGSKQTVLMRVAKVELSPSGSWLFLNSMKNHRHANCFTIAIGKEHLSKLEALGISNTGAELLNTVVRVTGDIIDYAKRIEIKIVDPKHQLEIVRDYDEPTTTE